MGPVEFDGCVKAPTPEWAIKAAATVKLPKVRLGPSMLALETEQRDEGWQQWLHEHKLWQNDVDET